MMPWEVLGGLDAILHVIFAFIAMIIIYPSWKEKIPHLLAFAIIMEFVIDGAHLVNKSITHNIFFFVEVPLFMLFAGYLFRDRKMGTFSLLLLANNLTHMFMDLFYEGDAMQIYYPFWNTWYSVPSQYLGAAWGTTMLLIFIIPMAIFTRERWKRPTPPPTLPPYPT